MNMQNIDMQAFRKHHLQYLKEVRYCERREDIHANAMYVNGLVGGAFLVGSIDHVAHDNLFKLLCNARDLRRKELSQ